MSVPRPGPFAAMGENVTIYPQAKIVGAEHITLGSNIIIDDFVLIIAVAPITIGNYVHIASFSSITGGGQCYLEDFATLSSGVRIFTGTDDYLGGGLTNPTVPPEFRTVHRGRTVVCSHAIIGANSVVLCDAVVGQGAAVGAGSVVNRDLRDWWVHAGVPSRPLKPRPSQTVLDYEQQIYARYGRPPHRYQDSLP